MPKRKPTLREQAEANVLAVRGSYDAPGFEVCVEAEMRNIENANRINEQRAIAARED